MGINFRSRGSNNVQINGKSYNVPNGNISIIGEDIYVNGKRFDTGDEAMSAKILNIVINGDVDKVEGNSVEVSGNAGNVSTVSGDISIRGSVDGNVSSTSGDVEISGSVSGNVSTISGDIKRL